MNIQKIRPELKPEILRFDSGNSHLDRFLQSDLAFDDSIGKTYVLLSDSGDCVIGYYNIGMGSVEQIDGDLRRKIGGAVHINCFAVDKRFQDQVVSIDTEVGKIHISDLMLHDCMKRIMAIRKNCIGVAFITLNSTKEGEWLYKRNEFDYLEDDMDFAKEDEELECRQMYLALDLVDM